MKKLLTPKYEKLITDKHLVRPWGGSGWRWIPEVALVIVKCGLKQPTVLDYGAGRSTFKTTMAWAMPHVRVAEYDPGVAELAVVPTGQFDIVLCTDVLEHVERQFVDETLDRLRAYTRHAAVLNIACTPASSLLPDGTNTHVTVESPDWWEKKLATRWARLEASTRNKNYGVIAYP